MRRLSALFLLLALVACAPREAVPPSIPAEPLPGAKPGPLELRPASFADLPGWQNENFQGVAEAFLKSCQKLKSQPAWSGVCSDPALARGDGAALKRFFESRFKPWRATAQGNPDGLFTGYYEAELPASHRQISANQVPLYALPSDLVTADLSLFDPGLKGRRLDGRVEKNRLVPYHSRAEIEAGALSQKAAVIAWADAVDAHILQIQGSGRLLMDDGSVLRAGFAGSNGLPFKGIGAILKEKGKIGPGQDSTMPAIERWLKSNPSEARRLMAENKRYIFFRKIEGDGPIGAFGVPLTPERSLAVDTQMMPLGAPVWLATRLSLGGQPYQRLVMAQDAGSAIKGAVRGDIFFGHGRAAFDVAGRQKETGRYWLLLPEGVAPESALP